MSGRFLSSVKGEFDNVSADVCGKSGGDLTSVTGLTITFRIIFVRSRRDKRCMACNNFKLLEAPSSVIL